MNWHSAISAMTALALAPLMLGIVTRVKSAFAGRRGPSLAQPYFDIIKLLRKGATYSATTSWVFRAGPVVGLACAAAAVTLVPLGGAPALLAFQGDAILFAYLFALMRFATVIAALDTGSSFEGIGASREVLFSALAEPALFLGLAALAHHAGSVSLTAIVSAISAASWATEGAALALVLAAFFVVLLAENCRIPVDDPNTHLELTMVHEVMVLDHSGPDLAFIEYAAALKFWALGALVVGLLVPVRLTSVWEAAGVGVLGMVALAAVVGVLESCMARLRLVRVSTMLVGAGALSAVALALLLR